MKQESRSQKKERRGCSNCIRVYFTGEDYICELTGFRVTHLGIIAENCDDFKPMESGP